MDVVPSVGAGTPNNRDVGVQEPATLATAGPVVARGTLPGSSSPPGDAASAVAAALTSSGAPLDDASRALMESRFGYDFAHVRIHADDTSAAAARAVNARAFTVGNDIVFGRGQYETRSSGGRRLLAHELTHVVQQRGSALPPVADGASLPTTTPAPVQRSEPLIARQPAPAPTAAPPPAAAPGQGDAPEQTAADRAPGKLRPVVQQVLNGSLGNTNDATFGTTLGSNSVQALGSDATPEEGGEISTRADAVAAMTATYKDATMGIPAALRAIAALHQQSQAGTTGLPVSLGLPHLIGILSKDIADHFTGALASAKSNHLLASWITVNQVQSDLSAALEASGNGERLLSLELEGTINEVLRLRSAFEMSKDQSERKSLGLQLGEASRRALLLNQALEKMPKPGEEGHSALDKQVLAVSVQIGQIRQSAQSEDATKKAWTVGGKDEASLLTVQNINPAGPTLGPASGSIKPEEALPTTTDAATNSMMNDLNRQVKNQQAEIDRLKNQVVPEKPTYDLAEFTAVFKRWFAFYSQTAEAEDPIIKVVNHIMGAAYPMAGMAALSGPSAASGAAGRALMMNQMANIVEGRLPGASGSDFAGQLKGNAPQRAQSNVSGSASNPNYKYGDVYGDPNARPPGPGAERDSRQALIDKKQREAAALAALQAAQQQAAPGTQTTGGTVAPGPGGSPQTAGMKNPQAQQGWTYLITVPNPNDPGAKPIGAEQKTVPPEVAAYLLAQQQHAATLSQPHKPEIDGAPVGDKDVRDGGVEAGKGTNAATYTQGAQNAAPSAASQNLNNTLTDARTKAGITNTPKGEQADRAVQTLIADLERYLSGYFEKNQDTAMRLGAVFVIAVVQYGAGEALKQLSDPKTLKHMFEEAMKISLIIAGLQTLGPVGVIAARAYEAYLATQGISNLAGIIGLATYLRNASQANSFVRARVWAFMSRYAIEDLSQVVGNLVGHAASPHSKALADHVSKRPNTAGELAATCKPLMDHPQSRQALLEGVTNRIAEIEGQGPNAKEGNAEYDSLVAFRDMLHNRPSKAKADTALAGREAKSSEAMDLFAAGKVRTDKERAALQAALPPDLIGKVPIIEDPTLTGNTVHVAYDNGRLRIEVGPLAEPKDIRSHVETARKFQKYEGVIGLVRQLIDRAKTALRITPGYGTKGFEAREEVQKLTRIIDDLEKTKAQIDARGDSLSSDPARAKNQAESDAIGSELANLREQLERHQKDIDSYEPGRGFVAAEARPTLEIPRESLVAIKEDPPKPGQKYWTIHFLADVEGQSIDWGVAFVPLDARGKPSGPPEMALNVDVKVSGKDVTLKLPKGENSSFTYYALKKTNQMYQETFGREPDAVAGSLQLDNLLNFQREFAREAIRMRAANPNVTRKEIARRTISQISFGRWRQHPDLDYTEFTDDDMHLGTDIEMSFPELGKPGEKHKVPSSFSVTMRRPEGPPAPGTRGTPAR
jgi:Domain of unknown function (DUF4157)